MIVFRSGRCKNYNLIMTVKVSHYIANTELRKENILLKLMKWNNI